jgi:hypothetical protein
VATHLYIVSSGDRVKIGVTSNIEQRIKTLSTGNPDPIELLYIEERYMPHKAEKYLHREFQKNRVRGEWFEGVTVQQIRSRLMLFHEQECEPKTLL